MSSLFLHNFVPRSRANGPGERAVVWVQGCPRRCPGCWNPDSLAFDQRNPTPVEEIVEKICAVHRLDGVTFSGGEPFSQAAPLAELARELRLRLGESFTVICFSGYTLEQIRSGAGKHPERADLLQEIDLLVDGAYVESLRSIGEPLRGSSNQKLHFLSGRIRPDEINPSTAEFTLGADGVVTQTGYPDTPDAEEVFAHLEYLPDWARG